MTCPIQDSELIHFSTYDNWCSVVILLWSAVKLLSPCDQSLWSKLYWSCINMSNLYILHVCNGSQELLELTRNTATLLLQRQTLNQLRQFTMTLQCSDIADKQRRLAEIVEMIHTASLVHDDVLDECDTRRGETPEKTRALVVLNWKHSLKQR